MTAPSASYSSESGTWRPYCAAQSFHDSFRVGRRAAWIWASTKGMPPRMSDRPTAASDCRVHGGRYPHGIRARLTQHEALDLASHCLGQLAVEVHDVRVLIALEPLLAPGLQLLRERRRGHVPGAQGDAGLEACQPLHRDADHGGLQHRRVLAQRVLDLDR